MYHTIKRTPIHNETERIWGRSQITPRLFQATYKMCCTCGNLTPYILIMLLNKINVVKNQSRSANNTNTAMFGLVSDYNDAYFNIGAWHPRGNELVA